MTDAMQHQGRCLCGAVGMTVKVKTNKVDACHCTMCRTWAGGPLFGVGCGADVQFDGEDNITVFQSSDWAERGFCRVCGTHLFYRLKKEGHYEVPVGLLEDGGSWVLRRQIFIDEKPDYYAFANETKNMTGPEVFALYSGESA